MIEVTRSSVNHADRYEECEEDGCWVTRVKRSEFHAGGVLVSLPAQGEPDDLTFTAPNGKRYWDVPSGVRWSPTANTEPQTREEIEACLLAKVEKGEAETGLYKLGLSFVVVDRVGVNGEITFQWFDEAFCFDDLLQGA